MGRLVVKTQETELGCLGFIAKLLQKGNLISLYLSFLSDGEAYLPSSSDFQFVRVFQAFRVPFMKDNIINIGET